MKEGDRQVFKGQGKIILFGEHAVVYGYPALAAGISRGVLCEILAPRCPEFRVIIPQWGVEVGQGGSSPISEALRTIVAALPKTDCGCSLKFHLEIPTGAGLGSSASISVAMIRALLSWHDIVWPLEQINDLAFKAECAFHGTPSGIDNTVATFGGLCYLSDPSRFPCPFEGCRQLRLNRGTASLLLREIAPISVVVIHTCRARQTRAMVAQVRIMSEQNPELFSSTMAAIGNLAVKGYGHLVHKEYRELGELMNLNHRLLQSLGVSCPELDLAVATAREAEALGAKLTGAGGGGCAIAFAPGNEERIVSAASRVGFPSFIAEITS